MKWLAAALAVAVILLQYRVWFSEDGVHAVSRLQRGRRHAARRERAARRAQPPARRRGPRPEDRHGRARGARAQRPGNDRPQRDLLPGRAAAPAAGQPHGRPAPRPPARRARAPRMKLLARHARRGHRAPLRHRCFRSSTRPWRAARSSTGRSRPSSPTAAARRHRRGAGQTMAAGSAAAPACVTTSRRRAAQPVGARGLARDRAPRRRQPTGCWCTMLRAPA